MNARAKRRKWWLGRIEKTECLRQGFETDMVVWDEATDFERVELHVCLRAGDEPQPNREEPDMTNTNLTATKLDVVEIIEAGQRWTYPRGAWGVRRKRWRVACPRPQPHRALRKLPAGHRVTHASRSSNEWSITPRKVARLFHVPEYMLTGVRRLARPRRRIPLRRVGRLL